MLGDYCRSSDNTFDCLLLFFTSLFFLSLSCVNTAGMWVVGVGESFEKCELDLSSLGGVFLFEFFGGWMEHYSRCTVFFFYKGKKKKPKYRERKKKSDHPSILILFFPFMCVGKMRQLGFGTNGPLWVGRGIT